MKSLKVWFSCLPKPQPIQSDNGSHFTAGVVQEWAKGEEIQWVFHTPDYPQDNGVMERTNRLLKRALRPHDAGWVSRVPQAVYRISSRWGANGWPRLLVFCPVPPSFVPGTKGSKDPVHLLHYAGQPVLGELPTVGQVPLTLKTPPLTFMPGWPQMPMGRSIVSIPDGLSHPSKWAFMT